jgi:hypothetical protein
MIVRAAQRCEARPEHRGRFLPVRAFGLQTLGVLALLAACRNGDRVEAAGVAAFRPSRVAELYFSTEVGGYMEPCGCTTEPLGGVQRLASVIAAGHGERALVDAGNLFFPSKFDEIEREQHILKARVLARVYRQLGAVAINVAASDLGNGSEFLKELQREGAVPLVSANVRPIDGGPAIAQSFVRTVGGIKIGITGVATPEAFGAETRVTAIEYAPILGGEVKALEKRGAEIIVVLAHVGDAGARELARAVPGIDVIIRAPGTPIDREPSAPVQTGGVIIAEAGSQGQHVGRLTLALAEGPVERPLFLDDAGFDAAKRRKLAERKIRAFEVEIAAWSVDAAKAEAVNARKRQVEELRAELARPAPAPRAIGRPHARIDLVPLRASIPSDPALTKMLEGYYSELAAMNAEKGDRSKCEVRDPKVAVYVGSEKCVECHEEAYEFWKKTKHADAWETLEKDNKHFDLTCVKCHTVGYQRPGGFCRVKDVAGREDVGCENCHGPGSIHSVDQDPSTITLRAPESTCASECHVPEHSDAFVYEKYLKEITGPGHELSEG